MTAPVEERHDYDHDGFARHHHDATGEPVWWGNCEQFGGGKHPHHHGFRAAQAGDTGLRERIAAELEMTPALKHSSVFPGKWIVSVDAALRAVDRALAANSPAAPDAEVARRDVLRERIEHFVGGSWPHRLSDPDVEGVRHALDLIGVRMTFDEHAGWRMLPVRALPDEDWEARIAQIDAAIAAPRLPPATASTGPTEPTDVERLAVAINAAQVQPSEMKLGHDLRVPAARIAAAYDRMRPTPPPQGAE